MRSCSSRFDIYTATKLVFGGLCFAFWLGGCGEGSEVALRQAEPVAIEVGDECHICGMVIVQQPGPKGEVVVLNHQSIYKFCSTTELFTWLLQPENRHLRAAIYVHDMGRSDWQHPDDRHLIDAAQAWYVVGSARQGGMGPALVSFKHEDDAKAFVDKQRGELLRFAQITLEKLLEAGAR